MLSSSSARVAGGYCGLPYEDRQGWPKRHYCIAILDAHAPVYATSLSSLLHEDSNQIFPGGHLLGDWEYVDCYLAHITPVSSWLQDDA